MVEAHHMLGTLFEKGEGLPQSHKQAAYYFMYAADRYYTEAQWKVGSMFENGFGMREK